MKKYRNLMGCMAAVALLAACAGGPNKRSAGQVIDDATILAKAKSALINDPEIKGTHIDVDVERGKVTLTGFVRSDREREKVLATVWGVSGVKSVRTDIQVKPPNP